ALPISPRVEPEAAQQPDVFGGAVRQRQVAHRLRRDRARAVVPRQPDLFADPEARRRRRAHVGPALARGRPRGRSQAPADHRQVQLLRGATMSSICANAASAPVSMTKGHKKVIFASSLGTVFEWYDFYLYGSLAAIIARQFFTGLNPTSGFIFALLAFAAGFAVRPFGALVFGRLGDLVGRKYTFLITIVIMGLSTFLVGVLPSYTTIGFAAPVILITLRLLQGLALGGEY